MQQKLDSKLWLSSSGLVTNLHTLYSRQQAVSPELKGRLWFQNASG